MKHTVGLLGPARKILTKCCVQMACGMLSAIGDFLQTGIDEIMKVNTADILIVCFVNITFNYVHCLIGVPEPTLVPLRHVATRTVEVTETTKKVLF